MLTVTFLLLLGLVITSLQNSMPLELKFITWNLQMIRFWSRKIYSHRSSMRFGRGGLMEESTAQLLCSPGGPHTKRVYGDGAN